MRVLGLDVATCTGFALMDSPNKLIEYGTIKLKSKDNYRVRFKKLRLAILLLIDKFKPDLVVLETALIMGGKRHFTAGKTIAYLNNLRGIVLELVPDEVGLESVNVRTARKQVLRNGKLTKEQTFHLIVSLFTLKDFEFKKHNDITDAILLAQYGIIKK